MVVPYLSCEFAMDHGSGETLVRASLRAIPGEAGVNWTGVGP